MLKPIFFIMLLIFTSSLIGPDQRIVTTMSGNDLLKYCESTDGSERTLCNAYISGVRDGATVEAQTLSFDMPLGVTSEQLQDIVVKYLKGNPENRHQFAGFLVLKALRNAYPK